MFTYYPPGGEIWPPKPLFMPLFTPIFRLHAVTAGSGDRDFGYFLRDFHVLIDIYPLVPFPPSVCEEDPVYTSRVRGSPSGSGWERAAWTWTTRVTSAREVERERLKQSSQIT